MEHFDVLIIGAGLSGIDAAYHLKKFSPQKSYVILENRERIGGTWDLFNYPGIRSDSDMLTMSYHFKPWVDTCVISPGDKIRNYIIEAAVENSIDKHIRFCQNVNRVSWDSNTALWTIDAIKRDENHRETPVRYSARFLISCAGYYRYSEGYIPEFKGREQFKGTIIHPQNWPENFDYKDKRVIVIGSGATAVTLLPNIAKSAAHVTMLQRSPTYYIIAPSKDRALGFLKKILPLSLAYKIIHWRNICRMQYFFKFAKKMPQLFSKFLIKTVAKNLPKDYDVNTHFTPHYNPWDQRLCLVPDADMFKAISDGKASVVTDHIDTITEKGILLKSGKHLDADVIVTATGLQLQMLGGIEVIVDGKPINIGQQFVFKGMMLTNVPNLVYVFGYLNASWTLRADLVSEWITRLLNLMDENGTQIVTAHPKDLNMNTNPFFNLSSGYLLRTQDILPKQGTTTPWVQNQNYFTDIAEIRKAPVENEELIFTKIDLTKKANLSKAA